jgi:hypothetical protein
MTATASLKTSVALDSKLTAIQNRLFERAHAEPLELKFLGIALSKQGIIGNALYANPYMIPLPLSRCEYLKSLNSREVAILSACFFASFYKTVANSESQALISNMAAAEKSFEPYSDEYIILHQETSEEMDHIWTFRAAYNMVAKETGSQEQFDAPGFFRGVVGSIPQRDYDSVDTQFTLSQEHLRILELLHKQGGLQVLLNEMKQGGREFRYRAQHFLIGDAMRLLPPAEVQALGLGGLWLLIRYIANVELKQGESYLFADPEKFNYEPLAYSINQGHLHDEARHYTTSFDIGLSLYQAASPEAQAFIRELVRMTMEDYIKGQFLVFPEMLDANNKGILTVALHFSRETLKMALSHPEFSDKQANIDVLLASWGQMEWPQKLPPFGAGLLTQKRWRYIAQQYERARKAMDFEFDASNLGNLLQRYHDILAQENLTEAFTLA